MRSRSASARTCDAATRLDSWAGPVSADAGEVADWRWAPLAAVQAETRQHPQRFTAWFVEEMTLLGWLSAAGHRRAWREIEARVGL